MHQGADEHAKLIFRHFRDGMEVCDINGEKIGTLKGVERIGTVGGGYGTAGGSGYVHIDTGFLGLGKDYYIPFDSFGNCTNDSCFLNIPKDQLDNMGWDQKPFGMR